MTKPHALIVSYHFYPSAAVGAKRPSELAKFLESNGYKVSVLRGCEREDAVADVFDTPIDIYSVKFPRKLVSSLWRKIKPGASIPTTTDSNADSRPADTKHAARSKSEIFWPRRQLRTWMSFLQGDKIWLVKAIIAVYGIPKNTKFDVIIATGPPVAGYLTGIVAARRFKAPLILDFRDPWYRHSSQESQQSTTLHPLARVEDYLGQMCISHCSGITTASPGTASYTKNSYDLSDQSVDVVLNGYDPDAICESMAPTGRLELLYAGTLYLNRNPFPFLKAIRDFADLPNIDRSKIQFILVGNCNDWNGVELLPWLQEQCLTDIVKIRDAVGHSELGGLISSSNVLVNFAQGQALQIPAKSYEYLVAGRDLILIAEEDSDVARLYSNAGVGLVIPPEDQEKALNALGILYDAYVTEESGFQASGRSTEIFSRGYQLHIFKQLLDNFPGNSTGDSTAKRG